MYVDPAQHLLLCCCCCWFSIQCFLVFLLLHVWFRLFHACTHAHMHTCTHAFIPYMVHALIISWTTKQTDINKQTSQPPLEKMKFLHMCCFFSYMYVCWIVWVFAHAWWYGVVVWIEVLLLWKVVPAARFRCCGQYSYSIPLERIHSFFAVYVCACECVCMRLFVWVSNDVLLCSVCVLILTEYSEF